ncbi:MAG: hypothetical protein KAQ97_01330 [Candidatus Fermentibacteraceae bacterium]|nr:hypothetical protein [Candidatus Fermentibacteraceae bacterium]
MKIIVASLIIMAFITLYTSCGDSATEITGTLPIVTGITVDSAASIGDTIVVTWTALSDTQIEGYFLWTRTESENPWILVEVADQNIGTHIADRSAFYTVMAFFGNNTSSDTGLPDNTRAELLSESRQFLTMKPVGFRVDIEGDSLIPGNPSSLDFHQQFTVAFDPLSENKYIYPGTAKPAIWPGGAGTMVSSSGGFVAPAPSDTTQWQDSISYGGNFFLALEDGYFCMLTGFAIHPDTLAMVDTLIIDGQLQTIKSVRVFNSTW